MNPFQMIGVEIWRVLSMLKTWILLSVWGIVNWNVQISEVVAICLFPESIGEIFNIIACVLF